MAAGNQESTTVVNAEKNNDETEQFNKLLAILQTRKSEKEIEKWICSSYLNATKDKLDLYRKRLAESKHIVQKANLGELVDVIKETDKNRTFCRYYIGHTNQDIGTYLFDTVPQREGWESRAHFSGKPVKRKTFFSRINDGDKTDINFILDHESPLCLNAVDGLSHNTGIVYILLYDFYGECSMENLKLELKKHESDVEILKEKKTHQAKEVNKLTDKLESSSVYRKEEDEEYKQAFDLFVGMNKEMQNKNREIVAINTLLALKKELQETAARKRSSNTVLPASATKRPTINEKASTVADR